MKKLLIPIVLLLAAATACKKNTDTNNPVTTTTFKTYSSINDIFSLLSLQPKMMIFDAADGASFYGNSGTRYIFRKNTFQDATGAVVTGNVQVAVTEYVKKGDMIFSGVLPVSDDSTLISGGEINVVATQNGKEIFLRPDSLFQANIPQHGSKDTVMSLFRGNTNGSTTASNVNWQLTEKDTANAIVYKGDTISILSDSLNYWNCDHFSGFTNLQSFTATINCAIPITSAPYTYALFQNYNGLIMFYNSTGNSYNVTNIPVTPIHIISFVLIGGHFYAGVSSPITPKTGQNYTVTLTEVDPADFKAQINGLY